MAKITNEQIYREVREVRTVLLGVPDSEDMGLYGEVKNIRKEVKILNGTVKNDHAWLGAIKWFIVLIVSALGGMWSKVQGWW